MQDAFTIAVPTLAVLFAALLNRSDLQSLRSEFRAELQAVRAEFREDHNSLRAEIIGIRERVGPD
jgi:hypothetical protein